MSHFELTDETVTTPSGVVLHRIRATRDLPHHDVKCGDLGGWVESTDNLSDRAWVSGDAQVSGNARVFDNAQVFGRARVHAPQDILVIGPIGSENQSITLARTSTGHHLNIGCWDGTLDELAAEVARRAANWPATHRSRWRDEYAAAEQLLRHRAEAWRNSEGGDQ